MSVLGNKAYSDTNRLGSQSKAGVVQPLLRGEMPDPAFEAPTYFIGDLGLFPHGKVGTYISQMWNQHREGRDRKDFTSCLLLERMARDININDCHQLNISFLQHLGDQIDEKERISSNYSSLTL